MREKREIEREKKGGREVNIEKIYSDRVEKHTTHVFLLERINPAPHGDLVREVDAVEGDVDLPDALVAGELVVIIDEHLERGLGQLGGAHLEQEVLVEHGVHRLLLDPALQHAAAVGQQRHLDVWRRRARAVPRHQVTRLPHRHRQHRRLAVVVHAQLHAAQLLLLEG